MKMLAVIADGRGRVHIKVTRAPNQVRREYADATGQAQLLHAFTPLSGAAPMARILAGKLAKYSTRSGGYLVSPEKALRMVRRIERQTWVETRMVRPIRSVLRKGLKLFKTNPKL